MALVLGGENPSNVCMPIQVMMPVEIDLRVHFTPEIELFSGY
jgi:hypothetical protein